MSIMQYPVVFSDVDECGDEDPICSKKGVCHNLIGGYKCTCDVGFKFNDEDYGSGCTSW